MRFAFLCPLALLVASPADASERASLVNFVGLEAGSDRGGDPREVNDMHAQVSIGQHGAALSADTDGEGEAALPTDDGCQLNGVDSSTSNVATTLLSVGLFLIARARARRRA